MAQQLDYIERLRARRNEYACTDIHIATLRAPDEPQWRTLEVVDPPPAEHTGGLRPTVQEARELIRKEIRDYMATPNPDHILLLRTLPGTGKTTAAAEVAEELAADGRRVAYAGPRHDFFEQVVAKAQHPDWWYEWLPRQEGSDERPETCRYTRQISEWMTKGYPGIEFCRSVCGWDYVNERCPYHAQKRRVEPIIFIQHQHVTLGHPLDFAVMIGDESPLGAWLHEWVIPGNAILPPGMDHEAALTHMLYDLALIAGNAQHMEGEELLEYLGGAAAVAAAVDDFRFVAGVDALVPRLRTAADVETAPWFHLPDLAMLLGREAAGALAGKPYPHRVLVHAGQLHLLLRHAPDPRQLPSHLVWLDATGQAHIYEELFGRAVRVVDIAPRIHGRIFQVVDRANGKATVIDRKTKQLTSKGNQLEQQIQRIIDREGYTHPVLISYQQFVEQAALPEGLAKAHFYAARGTNEYERCDAVIVAGMPQPALPDLARAAKMIFWRRDEAFKFQEFTSRPVVFDYVGEDGMGRAYPVSNFWTDDDLRAVLTIMREDEILQAAHRGRPVNRAVDIWLLLNAPIPGLPPDELMTIRDLMGSPGGVSPWQYARALELAETIYAEKGAVTMADLRDAGVKSPRTAAKYFDLLTQAGWVEARVPGRTKDFRAIRKGNK